MRTLSHCPGICVLLLLIVCLTVVQQGKNTYNQGCFSCAYIDMLLHLNHRNFENSWRLPIK
jgi:hypothetical protein